MMRCVWRFPTTELDWPASGRWASAWSRCASGQRSLAAHAPFYLAQTTARASWHCYHSPRSNLVDRQDRQHEDSLRVLIVDDHPIFRDGIRALLASVPDFEIAGEAATGDEAIAEAATLQPDVVLMDLQMPGIGGVEATRQILFASPHIRVLIVTMFEDDYSVFSA